MPTQTPISRKFVPPSSTNPSRGQAKQNFFIQPSHASSPPYSYSRTPFSSTAQKKQARDQIETDDVDDEGDQEESSRRRVVSSRTDRQHDDLVDDFSSTGSNNQGQSFQVQKSTATQLHPSLKRRKISHSASETIDDEVDLPSPPISPTHPPVQVQVQVRGSSPETHSPGNDSSSTPTSPGNSPAQAVQTPKHQRSRFQPPDPASTPHHQVYPSFQSRLLATSTSTTTFGSPWPGPPPLRGPQPSLDLTLPDSFSPSRKRGQREYTHNGLAEMVRGWVIDLATRASTTTPAVAGPSHQAGTHAVTLVVDEVVLRDASARFALIRARADVRSPDLPSTAMSPPPQHAPTTVGAQEWLLINTDSNTQAHAHVHPQPQPTSPRTHTRPRAHGTPPKTKIARVKAGVRVTVRGGDDMTWDLHYGGGDGGGGGVGTTGGTRRVAVLWEVI